LFCRMQYVCSICRVGQNGIYVPYMYHIFGDFPAKNIVYASSIYGSGQP